mgnify:CR=1 FL=1
MVLRSDEEANLAELERDKRFSEMVGSGLKTGLGTISGAIAGAGIGGAIGSGTASRIMPFLNEYIPMDLALKGISKISPKVGDFLKRGMKAGLDVKDGLNFIKEQITPGQQSESQSTKDKRNIIQQYDPELDTYIKDAVKNGKSAIQAGMKALDHPRFKKAIGKLTKDHNVGWDQILQSIYGSNEKGISSQVMQKSMSMDQPQPSSQSGQGQAALMAILQKIQQSRGTR